jgi:predicted nucleotidyltransferase
MMLDLAAVDLDDLCVALEDHSYESSWWIHQGSGEIRFHNPDVDESADDLGDDGWVNIDPLDSREAYRDMEAFVALVPERRAADLLERAIAGRGAFRRFKDTLLEFPELRQLWFTFHDTRLRRRAIEWLAAMQLVPEDAMEMAAALYPDPPLAPQGDSLVDALATDLRALYGERLVHLLVFGSRGRGDAEDESDLDLLVVLEELESPWVELRRMDEVLWRHTERSGVTVSAWPISGAEFDQPTSPALIRARSEAVEVV